MTLAPAALVLTLGGWAWWMMYRYMLESVDARMSLPANAFTKRVGPHLDREDFQRLTTGFVNDRGDEDGLSWIAVVQNADGEVISESEAGLVEKLDLVASAPLPEDWVSEPPREDHRSPRSRHRPEREDRDRRDRRPPPPPRRDHRGGPKLPPTYFTKVIDGNSWRVGRFTNRFASVFVGVDLASFHEEVRRMREVFLWAVFGGIGLSAVVGWLVASKAIRPVNRIVATAEQVTAKGLDQRIPLTAREDKEFVRMVEVLNAMMERLERSFHQAVRFSADASHELKTPLSVMRGEVERGLRECAPGSDEEQRLLNLNEEVHRLNKITEALLMLSRADAGTMPLERVTFDLSQALQGFCEDAEIMCQDQGLTLRTSIAEGLKVHADRALLLSVLHNLVSNAIKYNQEDGRVTIALREQGALVCVEVANTGPGIPIEVRPHIFHRFFRGDDARTRRQDGFGLGLNIAHEIVQAHGGTLRLLDGGGESMTRFAVILPQAA